MASSTSTGNSTKNRNINATTRPNSQRCRRLGHHCTSLLEENANCLASQDRRQENQGLRRRSKRAAPFHMRVATRSISCKNGGIMMSMCRMPAVRRSTITSRRGKAMGGSPEESIAPPAMRKRAGASACHGRDHSRRGGGEGQRIACRCRLGSPVSRNVSALVDSCS